MDSNYNKNEEEKFIVPKVEGQQIKNNRGIFWFLLLIALAVVIYYAVRFIGEKYKDHGWSDTGSQGNSELISVS